MSEIRYPNNRLRELRLARGLSLRALSNATGIDFATISFCEKGKRNFSANCIKQLSSFFGVSVDYLLGKSAEEIFEGFIDSLRSDFITETADREFGATQKTADFVGEPLRSKLAAVLEIDKVENPENLKAVLSLLSAFVVCELPDDPSIPELEPGAGEKRAAELRAAVHRLSLLGADDLAALVQMADLRLRVKTEDDKK